MTCFNGGCAGDRNHNQLHFESSNHPLVLNIKRTRKQVHRDEPPKKLTRVAIEAETEQDKYDTQAQVKCLACGIADIDKSLPQLNGVVDGVLKALTFASQQEIQAWQLELEPCEHTLCLEQQPARQIASQDLGHCSQCELNENLWLCLECGNLGCGRQQMGGAAGNSHGLSHATDSGHGVAVKLGSITAEGTADIYCYRCNDERLDTELTLHLAHWGIDIAGREKTEKSLMEMQLEHNLKYDFSMTTEDGKELQPLFGPGFTGLKNIGNTCYLASTIQCLFDLPEFQRRYYNPQKKLPATQTPAEDLETQLRKLADGILSGRYSRLDSTVSNSDPTSQQYQEGLSPAMFKHLVGRNHAEFSTMRQQDAFEFLLHLFKLINVSNSGNPTLDPVQSFRFALEQRLQCIKCKKVRYKVDQQDNISIPVPVRRIQQQLVEGEEKKDQFESVSLKECLDIFTSTDRVELTCSSCGSRDGFLKSSKFKTLPTNLAVNARRFDIVNWVPTKLDIPVDVRDEPFDMSTYMSQGLQPGEEELPEDVADSSTSSAAFVANEAAVGQLEAMGFPRVRAEKALHATGNNDAEAAMNWLFSHMDDPDIDEPIKLETKSTRDDIGAISQLGDMGISVPQARRALKECNGDVERALDWVFSHPDDQGDFEDDNIAQSTEARSNDLPGSSDVPALFELESIACHKGASIHAGHYVAFVKKRIDADPGRQWVLYNDEKVVKASNIEEMKKFAYVYFFRRKS